MPTQKPENKIEEHLRERVLAAGGQCLKFLSTVSGVPDRVVVLAGRTVFVELKAPGKKPRPLQRVQHRRLRSAGGVVYVIDSIRDADALVDLLIEHPATQELPAIA